MVHDVAERLLTLEELERQRRDLEGRLAACTARLAAAGLPTGWALIIISPTLFSPGVAAHFKNMVLRAQTHMGRPALGGFVIKADEMTPRRDHWYDAVRSPDAIRIPSP